MPPITSDECVYMLAFVYDLTDSSEIFSYNQEGVLQSFADIREP